MKRRIIMVLLALGALGGFAAGFAHLGCRMHGRHEAFERRVAQICVDAARNAQAPR